MDNEYPSQATSNKKRLFIVWAILLTAWILMTVTSILYQDKIGRLFADYGDIAVYFRIGKWFTQMTLPVSEYPQIPTLLFGINHLSSMWFEPKIQLSIYGASFSLFMMVVLFMVYKALLKQLPPQYSNFAFLVLLPTTIYYSYSRFDILPAYLCLLAYGAAKKKTWAMVSILLAVATFTKWYPALLFPGFVLYATRLEAKFQWKMIMVYSASSLAILFSSYLIGGLPLLMAPYQFHLTRSMEYVAFPVIINDALHQYLESNINIPQYFLIFFLLQISSQILLVFIKMDSLEKLTDYCIIVIGTFMIFSRIWSPQWFLWLMPFLVISARDKKTLTLIIVYNVMTYLCFPIIFDFAGGSSDPLKIVSLLTAAILFALIIRSIRNITSAKKEYHPERGKP